MGSHGYGAVKAAVLGSVAQRVAAHCATPLLLIREAWSRQRRFGRCAARPRAARVRPRAALYERPVRQSRLRR